MPELPEVESLKNSLAPLLVGRTIIRATIAEPRLRRRLARNFGSEVSGRRVERLERRAKYLLMTLSGEAVLMVHLGMSGSLTHRDQGFASDSLDAAHDHVEFELDDHSRLVYNDPRRFGLMKLVRAAELATAAELKALGPEPDGTEFNAEYLRGKARGRRVAVKNLLMDQRIVAGVGNIYASEILFRAGVRPTRRAGRLSRAEIELIVRFTPAILREAIGSGGTTFNDYIDGRGREGAYRPQVYDRAGQPCPRCATPIRQIVVGQRSSFFCAACQK
ncbi:MAG TPA: bifunctional DNA-formamidopyrimidine glycosylase/DNA-(apurinic or apyrimidinic site) lyase [Candidatus Binataceae bacterium]|nr:bifunctional DNA-formamidopyrimidine glycosylase/DNA-(apurinic or apyrimidinic site) lyase [Candidatus Binataceae bacterium]